jgi:putative ABC transport system ATP-binding protein
MGHDLSALPDAARARIRGRHAGLVFQQFNLVPSLTVAANVAIQARLSGRHDPARDGHLIDRLGLTALTERYPEQLSGRPAAARGHRPRPRRAARPDPRRRAHGQSRRGHGRRGARPPLELVAETGAAMLMVTHSERLAGTLSRRAALSRGRLVA